MKILRKIFTESNILTPRFEKNLRKIAPQNYEQKQITLNQTVSFNANFANKGVEPDSGIVTAPNRGIVGLRHVAAPENKPQQPKPQLPPGQNICADCERLIV